MDKAQQVALELRLENWGAWNRTGDHERECGSAERRYDGGSADEEKSQTLLDRLARGSINVADAELIERAILTLRRASSRRFLVYTYVRQMPNVIIARDFRIAPMMVRPHLLMILGALQYRLDHTSGLVLTERRQRRGLHSSKPSSITPPLTNVVPAP